MSQGYRYLKHLETVMLHGSIIRPRGEEVREVADLQLFVDPREPFMNFNARKYPMKYFKAEMLWKLGASKFDESIKQHAKMWESVQNPDGTFNSNYGQYWFGEQMGIWHVVMELIRDPDSRRAVIPMLSTEHMAPWTKDTVCTEAVSFRLRTRNVLVLDMSVHMRSSDIIFGLGTDIPTFSLLYRLVRALLQPNFNNHICWGSMCITAASSHIYERHYDMANKILEEGIDGYSSIDMPPTKIMEAMYIIAKRGNMTADNPNYRLVKWLLS